MGSSSDRNSEETVLQTQKRKGQKRIHDTKFKCITGNAMQKKTTTSKSLHFPAIQE
jgi:hypothetical protein